MTDLLLSISFIDLERLKDRLKEKIRAFFPFEGIRFYEWKSMSEAISQENLSQRQVPRVQDAILNGKPFFDRITNRIFFPLEWKGKKLGIAVFSDVGAMGIDEEERWLSLLRETIISSLRILKMETFFSEDHSIPPYVNLSIQYLCNKTEPSTASILILDMISNEGWEERLSQLMKGVWPGTEFEIIGREGQRFWLILKGVNEQALSSGLKRAFFYTRKKRLRIKGIFGFGLYPSEGPEIIFKRLKKLVDVARFLNASTLSLLGVTELEKGLEVMDLAEIINVSQKINFSGKDFVIAFGSPVSKGLAERMSQKWEVFKTGQGNAFFLQRKRYEPLEWGKELQDLANSLNEPSLTLGMVPAWKGHVRKERIFFSALMAYLHALLLGKGSLIEFDAVTLNVSGDEYFAMGDLINARKAYSSGLGLKPDNRKLLNSFGVCLAELGERKRAEDSFLKAMKLYPDDFIACYNLGGLYIEQGRVVEAENVLKKAYELKPNDPRVVIRYAEILCDAGSHVTALDVLKDIDLKGNEKLYYSYYKVMGMAYYGIPGEWPMARDFFQSTIKLNPSDMESLLFLSKGYLEHAGDRDTAVHLFRQVGNHSKNTLRAKKIYKSFIKILKLDP